MSCKIFSTRRLRASTRAIMPGEPLLAQRLARVHNHAAAKDNLAAIRSFQGRREEAEQLLGEVVAGHPDDLAARCNPANLAILDGDLEEADALLKGLATRRQIHVQDLFIRYGSMALLNRARWKGGCRFSDRRPRTIGSERG
jgi:predicted Zn-dependent protease